MADFEANPITHKLLEDLAKKIERHFKDAVEREGLTDTGEPVDSIKAGIVKIGDKTISANVVSSALLRIEDIKMLNYFAIPPISPVLDWVSLYIMLVKNLLNLHAASSAHRTFYKTFFIKLGQQV